MKTLSVIPGFVGRAFALPLSLSLAFIGLCNAATNEDDQRMIKGVVQLHQSVADLIGPEDRLVFKLFHPEDGIEKDLTYRIYRSPSFPFHYSVGPGLDMSKRTKWRRYVIEVSIDRDNNPGEVNADEPSASSPAPVRLGSSGIDLVLRRSR